MNWYMLRRDPNALPNALVRESQEMTMHPITIILAVGVGGVVLPSGALAIEATTNMVNWNSVQQEPFAHFIRYVLPPSQESLAGRVSDTKLLNKDARDCMSTLARVLRNQYLPDTNGVAAIMGVPEYLDGDDCLFLQYQAKNGKDVVVRDADALYIILASSSNSCSVASEIGLWVGDIASDIMNVPDHVAVTGNPRVTVSKIDIGRSRWGRLTWSEDRTRPWDQVDWYSAIAWWSDGKVVLFRVSKKARAEISGALDRPIVDFTMRERRRLHYRQGVP
jgi:hypothetical protein